MCNSVSRYQTEGSHPAGSTFANKITVKTFARRLVFCPLSLHTLSMLISARRLSSSAGRLATVLPSAMHCIHGTPTVELSRLTERLGLCGRIVAKLEYLSPGFSKKDRIARQMIEEARADGSLVPGQTVIELTSVTLALASRSRARL